MSLLADVSEDKLRALSDEDLEEKRNAILKILETYEDEEKKSRQKHVRFGLGMSAFTIRNIAKKVLGEVNRRRLLGSSNASTGYAR